MYKMILEVYFLVGLQRTQILVLFTNNKYSYADSHTHNMFLAYKHFQLFNPIFVCVEEWNGRNWRNGDKRI